MTRSVLACVSSSLTVFNSRLEGIHHMVTMVTKAPLRLYTSPVFAVGPGHQYPLQLVGTHLEPY